MKSYLSTSKLLTSMTAAALLTAALPFTAKADMTFGNSWDGADKDLQDLFNNIGADFDTAKDETGAELFEAHGNQLSGTILFEVAGLKNSNTFGIYNAEDKNDRFELFNGNNSAPLTKAINFSTIFASFEKTFKGVFGFYLRRGSTVFYSEIAKNAGEYDYFVAYQGDGVDTIDNNTTRSGVQPLGGEVLTASKYIVAFEDLPYQSSDKDYNDFVAVVRNVKHVEAVPEPAVMLGLAAFAGGAMTLRRRQTAQG